MSETSYIGPGDKPAPYETALLLVDIQNDYFPGATFFLPDTDGVRIHESVRPLDGEIVLQKHYPNAFRDKQLLTQLGLLRVARCRY